MAYLNLPNTVDSPETLLQSVRVPGQIVIDHEVGVLQVHTFTGCIGGHQYLHVGICTETLLNVTAVKTFDVAVNGYHCVWIPQKALDAGLQIIEGVSIFCKYD